MNGKKHNHIKKKLQSTNVFPVTRPSIDLPQSEAGNKLQKWCNLKVQRLF